MLEILFPFVLTFVFLLLLLRKEDVKGNVINGPKGLPVISNILEIDNKTIHVKFMEYAQQFGQIFRLKLLSNNVVVLNSEEFIRKALGGGKYMSYFGDRAAMFYGEHFRFNNQSLTFATDGTGDFHKTARKSFMQAIHTYGSGLLELENNVMKEMSNLCQKIESKKGKEIECVGMLQRSLANVLSLVLCGETISDDDPDVHLFWEHVHGNDFFLNSYKNFVMSTFPFLRHLPGKYGREFRNAIRANRRIAKRYYYAMKETYIPGQMRGIVDHYFEEQRKQTESNTDILFTDERVIAQLVETIDAGMTTSWSTLSNAMLVLLNHPEYQTNIQAELDDVIGSSRAPTYGDRMKCTFFQAFELEVHRYLTTAPLSLPHLCREHIEFEGYDIQANSTIITNAWYLHHNSDVWGDPWTFRPERFLDDNGHLLPKDHTLRKNVIPFGLGLRQCPGENFAKTRFFLYISNLLQRWNFEFPHGKKRSCDPRKIENFDIKVIMRAEPFYFLVKKRQ